MKKQINLISLLMILLVLTGCVSNGADEQVSSVDSKSVSDSSDWTEATAQIFAMDTIMTLTVNGVDAQEAADAAEEEIYKLESLFSVTDEESEIYAINASAGQPKEVSEETADAVAKGLEMSEMTSGVYNLSMYPILKEWGFTTEDYKIPDSNILNELLQNIDFSRILVDQNTITVPEGMEIDVGGLAKGYTGDTVKSLMENYGITSACLNLGGDVQVVGSKKDGSDWRVAIQDPFGGNYLGVLSVSDTSVMTSGSYERYFIGEDGKTYHHIIDPVTGNPAESGLVSATVVTDNGYIGDALATTLFIMGVDKATDFWRSNGELFEMILVSEDSEIYITEDLLDSFELGEAYENVQVNVISK